MDRKRSRKPSTRVAVGGISAGLCLTLIFLSGVFPIATYAMPMLAGLALLPMAVEMGTAPAALAFAAAGLLSLFISADREAGAAFVALFGYYPLVWLYSCRIVNRVKRAALRFIVKNLGLAAACLMWWFLIGPQLFSWVTPLLGAAAWCVAQVVLFIYDRAVLSAVVFYERVIRPKLFPPRGR